VISVKAKGSKGDKTPKAAIPHAAKLMYDQVGRIIRGLWLTEKSAPLKPIDKAIEPKAKIKKRPSRKPTIISAVEGW